MRRASGSFDGDYPQNRSEKEGAVSALLQFDVCEAVCVQSQERLLTDFCGGYCDVVPHVRLPVQWFGQCDLPVLHIDVELPLQVCVSIDEVPAKGTDLQKLEPKLYRGLLGANGASSNERNLLINACRKSVII